MKFVISINDEKYAAFCERAEIAMPGEMITRIGFTPENVPVPVPMWWCAGQDRWALVQGILFALSESLKAGEDCEIFEEDCVFKENYAEIKTSVLANVPDDWNMIYFGGQFIAGAFGILEKVEGNEHVLLTNNVHRNHNWICRNNTLQQVIDWFNEPCWSGKHTADWRLGYLQMSEGFKTYVPSTGWVAGQGAGMSELDKVEYPVRFWHFTEPERSEEVKYWNEFDRAKKEREENERFEKWKAEMEAKQKENEKENQNASD